MTSTLARITQDKVLGLLLGGALGDALGALFEGRAVVDAAELTAREITSSRLDYTDDTALSLVLATPSSSTSRRGASLPTPWLASSPEPGGPNRGEDTAPAPLTCSA
jgi:hypothetical protein